MIKYEVIFTNTKQEVYGPLIDWFVGKNELSIRQQFGKKWSKISNWKIVEINTLPNL